MRFLGYAAIAVILSASSAFAQARPLTSTPPLVVQPQSDASAAAQQIYQQNQSVRQGTLQENAQAQQTIQNMTQQNQALREQQSEHAATAPYRMSQPQ
jgi:hypothetical protein